MPSAPRYVFRDSAHVLSPRFLHWYGRLVVAVGLILPVFVFLQAATILHTKSSENVSLPAFIILLIGSLVIMGAGLIGHTWLLTWGGMMTAVGAIVAIIATVSYRPTAQNGAFVAVGV